MTPAEPALGDELHANFALRGWDYLGLIAGDGETVIDEFAPKYRIKKDIAFGILPGQAPGQAENLKRGFSPPPRARPTRGTRRHG